MCGVGWVYPTSRGGHGGSKTGHISLLCIIIFFAHYTIDICLSGYFHKRHLETRMRHGLGLGLGLEILAPRERGLEAAHSDKPIYNTPR